MSFEEMQSVLQGILLSQQQFQIEMVELKALANSNSRAIQAMLDNAATDRLEQKERTQQHEERMQRLENLSVGLVNLSTSIDEDRPNTVRLRKKCKIFQRENEVFSF
jgi:hypothetical protein